MKIRGKTFVVTGAGSGMGRELALNLLDKGASVAALDINAEKLAETISLAKTWQNNIEMYVVDVTDATSVSRLPQAINDRFGAIDGLINNAGIIQPFKTFNDLDFEAIRRVIGVNLYGTINMTKIFLPFLIDRPEAHLANVSSMGGFVPVPGQSIYGASKAAVKLLTEGLISELSETNVKISLIMPGAVNTNITSNSGVVRASRSDNTKMKILSPKDAAEIIISGIESDKQRILVGKDARIMDLISRINPLGAARLINKKMAAILK